MSKPLHTEAAALNAELSLSAKSYGSNKPQTRDYQTELCIRA